MTTQSNREAVVEQLRAVEQTFQVTQRETEDQRREVRADRREAIATALDVGLTFREVAEVLDVDPSRVARILEAAS